MTSEPPGERRDQRGARRVGLVCVAGLVLVLGIGGVIGRPHGVTPSAAAGTVGMIPAAPTRAATMSATTAPEATAPGTTASSPAPTRPIYTPPAAPTGVDRSADPVAASEQASRAAKAALLGWMDSDSAESAAQRQARLRVLFTAGNTLVDDKPPLLTSAAANCVGDGRVSFAEPTGTQTDTTGQFAIGVTWSMAAWPDSSGGTSTQTGTATAVVHVVLEGGHWVADSIDDASSGA